MWNSEGLKDFAGKTVVIDTKTPLIYLGRLSAIRENSVLLEDVDVHDINDTPTTKEIYIMEARKYGVKKNRHSTQLTMDQIVSISKLEDVIEY